MNPPGSPEKTSWDNPFPTFPGVKKKPTPAEQQMTQKMESMELGGPPQNRRRTAGSKGDQDRYIPGRSGQADEYGRPMGPPGRGGPVDDYGGPSVDGQRMPRKPPPQGPIPPQPQGYPDQRRGPPPGPTPGPAPGPGYGPPRQNGYPDPGYDDRGGYGPISPLREGFAPPPRSMTMPTEQQMPAPRQPPMMNGGAPDERPYNGPIGRGIPPRPSTASGVRPPPQKPYQPAAPQQLAPADSYGNQGPRHRPQESISDFYDSYYDEPSNGSPQHVRSQSTSSEMPDFDILQQNSSHRRGQSIDEHIKSGEPRQIHPVKSQPDFRAQPQAAVFEMASEVPPLPNQYQQGYDQGYSGDGYAPQNGYDGGQSGYGGYSEPPAQNGYQPPARTTSAAPRGGLPNGPRNGFGGPLNGPPPQQNGGMGPQNGAPNGARNGAPNGPPKPLSPDALPSHPTPVRAGLIPNSLPNQIGGKPPPVRNYNNTSPGNPQQPPQTPGSTSGAATPVTTAELDQLRETTKRNPSDQKTQLTLARKLVEASEVLVPKIPDQKARNKAREKYILEAHKLLKKLVAANNAEAMFYLADCYGRGALGLETDQKEAFSLYQSAAKLGHAAAAYRTAVCCELGSDDGGGTRKDPLKAMQWYKRAATLGDTPAMYKMGMILLKGLLGQHQNPREAVGWLKRAAERADAENPHALHELGLLYEQPQSPDSSIVRDEAYSLSLFQQAADLGYKFSQYRLGCAYEYGLFNLPIDPRQSIMWYSRAAVQEEHHSELALSGWYLTGSEGVLQQSDTEAYLWARKAAMAGLAKAEYAMGYFTEVGIGIPANLEDAKRWYWRAAGSYPFLLRCQRRETNDPPAQNFPKARERLEDLKKGGSRSAVRSRERISRSKVGKHNEGECVVM